MLNKINLIDYLQQDIGEVNPIIKEVLKEVLMDTQRMNLDKGHLVEEFEEKLLEQDDLFHARVFFEIEKSTLREGYKGLNGLKNEANSLLAMKKHEPCKLVIETFAITFAVTELSRFLERYHYITYLNKQ